MKLFRKHPPVLVFSAYRAGNTEQENNHNHYQQMERLAKRGIPFIEVQGRYKGEYERGFVVPDEHYDFIRGELVANQQACALYLDEYRKAYLVDCITHEQQYLGQWQTTGNLKDDEDHTYDPYTRQHYVVR